MSGVKLQDPEEVLDAFLLEQFISTLTPELEALVRDREPKKAADAATIVQRHVVAMKAVNGGSGILWRPRRGGHGEPSSSDPDQASPPNGPEGPKNDRTKIVCHRCQKK